MSAELPKMPEPIYGYAPLHELYARFTADQMREYAQEAARQAMERAALEVERVGPKDGALALVTKGYADAIRALIPQSEERHG